jgi:hypothetical protein
MTLEMTVEVTVQLSAAPYFTAFIRGIPERAAPMDAATHFC